MNKKILSMFAISVISFILFHFSAVALTLDEISIDSGFFSNIDSMNPVSEYQIRNRANPDLTVDAGGLCNISSITTLLNRRLAADGYSDTFSVTNVFQSIGCRNVITDGKLYSDLNFGTSGKKLYQYYYFNGNAGLSNDTGTTYSNGIHTYTITQIPASTVKSATTRIKFNEYVAELLHQHPEGIAVRNVAANHVEVIYKYTYDNGAYTLYVKDPVGNYSGPVAGSTIGKATGNDLYTNINFLLYINETPNIVANYNPATTLEFRDVAYPVNYGINSPNGYVLTSGAVVSNAELTSISSIIRDSNGNVLSALLDKPISGKYFSIRSLDNFTSGDNGVKFSSIKSVGQNYTWTLIATDDQNRTLRMVMTFDTVDSSTYGTATRSIEYNNSDPDPFSPGVDYEIWGSTSETSVFYINSSAPNSYIYLKSEKGTAYVDQHNALGIHSGYGNEEHHGFYEVHVSSIQNGNENLYYWVPSATTNNSGDRVLTNEQEKITFPGIGWYSVEVKPMSNSQAADYWKVDSIVRWETPAQWYYTEEKSNCTVVKTLTLVDGITLNQTTLSLNPGGTFALTATVSPDNATDKTVNWTTSDSSVATVSENGLVTAVAPGTATITATATDGSGKKGNCSVTVVSPVPTDNIVLSMSGYHQTTSISCGSASSLMILYYSGASSRLAADGIYDDAQYHAKYRKHAESDGKGIWLNEIVNGLNTYLGAGTYSLIGNVSSVDNLISTVKNSLSKNRPVICSCNWYGGHYVVIFGLQYENGTAYFKIKDPVQDAGATVTKTAAEFYATMPYAKNGNAHPVIYGTTAGGTIVDEPSVEFVGTEGIPSGNLPKGQSYELRGTITANENISSVVATIYDLSNNEAVSGIGTNPKEINPNSHSVDIYYSAINTSLKFGSLQDGAYRYTVVVTTASGYQTTVVDSSFTIGTGVLPDTPTIPDNPILVSEIALNQTALSLNPGGTFFLTATVSPDNATNKTVNWTTSDSSVATVSENGLVIAVAPGAATITASAADGSDVNDVCSVTVVLPVPTVEFVGTAGVPSGNLPKGQSYELRGTITASENISSVVGTIYNLDNHEVVSGIGTNPKEINPNSRSVDIYYSAINTSLKFSSLQDGAYRYTLVVTTASGYQTTVVDSNFTIGTGTIPVSGIVFTKMTDLENDDHIGASAIYCVQVLPTDAANKELAFSIDNEQVVSLSSITQVSDPASAGCDYFITLHNMGIGTAALTAASTDGSGVSAEIPLTVVTNITDTQYYAYKSVDGEVLALDNIQLKTGDVFCVGVNWWWSFEPDSYDYQFVLEDTSGLEATEDDSRHTGWFIAREQGTWFVYLDFFENDQLILDVNQTYEIHVSCAHTSTEWHETKAATCTEAGEKKLICDDCGEALDTEEIPALGHDWDDVVYIWNEDNLLVTASRVCRNNPEHTESEEVSATKQIVSPSETQNGTVNYLSGTFKNVAFSVQTKQFTIPAIGSLSVLRLPIALRTVEENAFEGINSQAVIIPDGCTSIGSRAFANCKNMIYVRIPASVTFIANDAFAGCDQVIIDRVTQ